MLLENTWWKCSLFSFPKRCQTTNASYSRLMKSRMENCSKSLQYGVFPSGHLVVLSQVFLMQLHSLTSLVTPVALLFCKCWRYSSVSVEDSQIFRTCQRKACWYKAYAPATEKHVARYQDQEMSCFSYLRCSNSFLRPRKLLGRVISHYCISICQTVTPTWITKIHPWYIPLWLWVHMICFARDISRFSGFAREQFFSLTDSKAKFVKSS